MLRQPAPNSILELVSCNCKKKKCESQSCLCVSHGLHCVVCVDLCGCIECFNMSADDTFSDYNSDDDAVFFSVNSRSTH